MDSGGFREARNAYKRKYNALQILPQLRSMIMHIFTYSFQKSFNFILQSTFIITHTHYLVVALDNLCEVAVKHFPPLNKACGSDVTLCTPSFSTPTTPILTGVALNRKLVLLILLAIIRSWDVLFLSENKGCRVDSLHLC